MADGSSPQELETPPTFGQYMADKVASFGGSWTFIGLFGLFMLAWTGLNGWLLLRAHVTPFDPYPFIFLNLMLSMLAAIQAPIIIMSQNRLAENDRRRAIDDFAINTKAEQEVAALHGKLDALTEELAWLRQQLVLALEQKGASVQDKLA
jgi:uncharacterized membrane protein